MTLRKKLPAILCAIAMTLSSVIVSVGAMETDNKDSRFFIEADNYEDRVRQVERYESENLQVLSATAAGLPPRIYTGQNLAGNYISGHFSPCYPANGGYDTISGKYIKQVCVTAWSIFSSSTKWTLSAASTADTSRYETYYVKNADGTYTKTDSYTAASALGWESGLEWEWTYF